MRLMVTSSKAEAEADEDSRLREELAVALPLIEEEDEALTAAVVFWELLVAYWRIF